MVPQTRQQRPKSPTVTLTWHASKLYKVHTYTPSKVYIRYTFTAASGRENRSSSSVALRPQKPYNYGPRGAQDVHLDFHTAPELSSSMLLYVRTIRDWEPRTSTQLLGSVSCSSVQFNVLLRPQRPYGLLGTSGSPGRPPRLSRSSLALNRSRKKQSR